MQDDQNQDPHPHHPELVPGNLRIGQFNKNATKYIHPHDYNRSVNPFRRELYTHESDFARDVRLAKMHKPHPLPEPDPANYQTTGKTQQSNLRGLADLEFPSRFGLP